MRAFFINPPTGLYVREDRCQSSVGDFAVPVVRPPMDLMIMAASLEAIGMECKIKDYPIEGGNWEVFKDDFRNFNPHLLIISTTTPTLKNDLLSCSIAKEINPGVLTIAKGAHFLNHDQEVLEEFNSLDIIIRGENDLIIREIATNGDRKNIAGITFRENSQVKRNKERAFLENLDELPLPARHLVKNKLYTRPDTGETMAVIETSRGCPGKCIFCLVRQVAGGKVRKRSIRTIIDEAEDCVTKYSIHNFHFKSDTFTWDKNWLIELCREITERRLKIKWICNSRVDTLDIERLKWMKQAGCFAVGFGVESGNQEILDKIRKGISLEQSKVALNLCRDFGIKSYAYFMIGFPWDNEQTIRDSIEFAKELNPNFVDFFLPYPFPGTELEMIAKKHNLIGNALDIKAYSHPIMNTLFLKKERLLTLKNSALRKFYMRPKYIFQTLCSAESPKVLRNYFYYGIKTLMKIN